MFISQHKDLAKQQLRGNVFTLLGCTIVSTIAVFICSFLMSLISGILIGALGQIFKSPTFTVIIYVMRQLLNSLLTNFVSGALTVGLLGIYLNMTRGRRAEIGDLFAYMSDFVSCGLLMFFMNLFVTVGTFFFVIPGVILAYSYSMAIYIYIENPGLTPFEAMKRSKDLMYGHKMNLFMLHISFFLWHLLIIVTCGLAAVYVVPYVAMAQANFYHSIKGGGVPPQGGGYPPQGGGYQQQGGGYQQQGGGYQQQGGGFPPPGGGYGSHPQAGPSAPTPAGYGVPTQQTIPQSQAGYGGAVGSTCSQCGSQQTPGTKFCKLCGSPVSGGN